MSDKIDAEDVDDLLIKLIDTYDLDLSLEAFAETETIGDVYDVVWNHLPNGIKQGGKCGTLVAYYRLRRWLVANYPHSVWRPNTRFASVPGFRYDRLEDSLAGWTLPGRQIEPSVWWLAGASALATTFVVWPFDHVFSVLMALCVFGSGVLYLHRVFRKGRCNVATLGAMAQHICVDNLARMKSEGATLSRKTLWRVFEMGLGQALSRDMRVA